MQRQVHRNAGGVVVLVTIGTGDDPGQPDGIEEGDGALASSGPAEGVFQRV